MADMRLKKNKDLLQRIRDRIELMIEADDENRRDGLEDLRFVNIPGEQWDDNMTKLRGDRPCYEFNKTRVRCKRIVNDMRDNRPSGKIRPVEGGDREGAEIREGLIRNILTTSHSDNATDYAAEYQVEAGMGAWRVVTKYADDSAFDQDIAVESLVNPFCLYCDPAAKEAMKRDAEDWALIDRISHSLFEARYGEKEEKVDFEIDSEFESEEDDWVDDETVRIAEYWYKVPHKKELWLMEVPDKKTGEPTTLVVDSESDEGLALLDQGYKPTRTRTVETSKIMMCIASGKRILEGPTEWAGHLFPFVMVYGEWKVIDGKLYWWGLPRFARDAQQTYNVSQTAIAEQIAQAPKEFFWATPAQAKGHVDDWATSHQENLPWKLYNPDGKAPGPPMRVGSADVPVALLQLGALMDTNLDDCMGLPDASLGKDSAEKSGRAIYARQQQGEIATFNYKDNMAKAMERTYEILLDLIPEVYDTERELRILGEDGKEAYKRINHVVTGKDGKPVRINDMAFGKYDATITVGPAFSTLRQEAAETYTNMGQQFPLLWQVAGDLVMKSMDLPYADDIGDRIKATLPQQIQAMLDKDQDVPPEVQAMMQRAEQAMQQVQQHGQLVQAAAQELEEQKAIAEKDQAVIKTELANVRAAQAEFKATVAEETTKLIQLKADLVSRDADLEIKEADLTVKEAAMRDKDAAIEAIDSIDTALATYMQANHEGLRRMEQILTDLDKRTTRKIIGGTTRREGGSITAEAEFSDGTKRKLKAVREKGELKLVPEPDSEVSEA